MMQITEKIVIFEELFQTNMSNRMKKRTLLILILAAFFTAGAYSDLPEEAIAIDSTVISPVDSVASEAEVAPEPPGEKRPEVYLFPIREQIMPSMARLTERCIAEATARGSDYVVIDLNTYGGLVDAADKIRTLILEAPMPVYAFINNQAASAGALIAIAANAIYMRSGASIGAATVVRQDGEVVPDKYQSFMRGMMRATAEAHGKVPEVQGRDTVWRWFRDPLIAEAMVDPTIEVPGLIDGTKVLTLTAEEAVRWHYCEGKAASVEEVLVLAGVKDYDLYEYKLSGLDRLLGFLTNPAFQGILIMLIIGGIYFELQTPGIGFPLFISIIAALLYFAPLYVEGLLAYWELILFLIGIALIMVEVFATPGFGVLGVAGIVAVVTGLVFAAIDIDLLKYVPSGEVPVAYIFRPFAMVIISVTAGLLLSIWLGRRFLTGHSVLRERVVLTSSMGVEEGWVSREGERGLIGMHGVATTVLRPTGKIRIDALYYEAAAEEGFFIEKGTEVVVVRDEGGVLYCRTKK